MKDFPKLEMRCRTCRHHQCRSPSCGNSYCRLVEKGRGIKDIDLIDSLCEEWAPSTSTTKTMYYRWRKEK